MSSEHCLQPVSEFEYNAKVKENEDLRKRIDALKQQVRGLKHKCTALEKWKSEHQTKWDAERKNYQIMNNKNNKKEVYSDNMVSMEQVKQFLAEYGGLSRYTIVDDDWHDKHPKAANHLLGFKTWEEGKQIMKMHFPDLVQSSPKLYLSRNSKRLQLETGTTLFERCVAVKLMERLGLAASKCGSIYSADERTVKSWRSDWQRKWGIDEIKVFQCQPLLGPSAVKKRKLMNEMAAAEIAAKTDASVGVGRNIRPPKAQDTSSNSQQHAGGLVKAGHAIGHEEFLIDREALHNRETEEQQDEAARASSLMLQETIQQPPLAAAVAAFIRNSNTNNLNQPYRGPFETGGYYL